MSSKHPVVAITGASGAGTTTVKHAFEAIFAIEKLNVAMVEGDSFHRYSREEMRARTAESRQYSEKVFTHYNEKANHLGKLEKLFKTYGELGSGRVRHYVHDKHSRDFEKKRGVGEGEFTPWHELPKNTDLLMYEGLHGGVVTKSVNVAQWVDLLVGVVPCINIEWMQKIWRDCRDRLYTPEQVSDVILERLPDYIKYIAPQFDRTHINFHRIPLIDTGNPFSFGNPKHVPTPTESMVVISARKVDIDLAPLIENIEGAKCSNEHTIVIPGESMLKAMNLLLLPIIKKMVNVAKST